MRRESPTGYSRESKPLEGGFVLPSVLLLITILSLVAISVMRLQLVRREMGLAAIARVKCEYAAESGIARAIGEIRSEVEFSGLVTGFSKTFAFDDGSTASVELRPWGVYLLARGE